MGVLTAKYSFAGELIGFGVTDEGLESGLPHALRLLAWEHTMQESTYPILGQTNSPGETRAPFNSARILEYLFRHPYNARTTDLVDSLGLGGKTAPVALKRFDAFGLVHYKAITLHTSKVPLEYVWDTSRDLGRAQYIETSHKLQDAVVTVIGQKGLVSHPRFSIGDIVQQLPEEITRRWKEKSLREHISKILSGFAKEGFLQRVDDFKGGEKQSDISLTKKGRSFFLRIILPVLLESPAQPLPASLSQLAQTSAELYYPYSRSSKYREKQNNIRKLAQAIGERPQAAQELAQGVELSDKTINRILSPHIKGSSEAILEVDGQPVVIERRKEKGVWYYSLKKPQDEIA